MFKNQIFTPQRHSINIRIKLIFSTDREHYLIQFMLFRLYKFFSIYFLEINFCFQRFSQISYILPPPPPHPQPPPPSPPPPAPRQKKKKKKKKNFFGKEYFEDFFSEQGHLPDFKNVSKLSQGISYRFRIIFAKYPGLFTIQIVLNL